MFSTTTRVLIRWARGLISVGDEGREQFIEIAGVRDYEEAKLLGESLIEAHKGQRGTTAVTGHVHNPDQQPAGGFYLVDKLNGQRVESISIGMDEEGYTVVTPELGDPLAHRLAAMNRRLAKASAGATSEWASPYADRFAQGEKIDNTPPTFGYKWQQPPEKPATST